MNNNAFYLSTPRRWLHPKLLLIMKLTVFILIIAFTQVSAKSYGQRITLNKTNATLSTVLKEIKNQSGYVFISNDLDLEEIRVSVVVKNAAIEEVLADCFKGGSVNYSIVDKTIVLSLKEKSFIEKIVEAIKAITVHGRIIDENGEPLPGATIIAKASGRTAIADIKGEFMMLSVNDGEELTITSIGYKPLMVKAATELGNVKLEVNIGSLDQVQVIGYGKVTKRFNTGSVSVINSEVIAKQPVTNVLSAISGQMAGVFVQTTNGLPGGNVNIVIRGQNSLRNTADNNGNYPLYIIDGVPYPAAPLNSASSRLSTQSVNGAQSPLNNLNPADIESISVLKDADATAIYGSRGANGVVLVTTKRGKAGAAKVSLNVSQGLSRVAALPSVLGLSDYLALRREAYANEGRVPSADPLSANYAPDLMVWSQTNSRDWPRYMLGGTAAATDVQAGVSGGTAADRYLVSTNYHSEGTVLPGAGRYERAGLHYSLDHRAGKFSLAFSGSFTADNNKLANPVTNLRGAVLTAANFDPLDAAGNLNWTNNVNPLADVLAGSKTRSGNLVTNAVLGYEVIAGLNLKTSVGYNLLNTSQVQTFPFASQNPAYGVSAANYGHNTQQALIIEPQMSYKRQVGAGVLDVLLGGTYQQSNRTGEIVVGSNFSNDALIENAGSAATITATNSVLDYRYISVFGRVNYTFKEKYIINASARRDGSSRFGPGKQFGNFGAVGAAWLFGDQLPFLSFGKLRGSYGITGNDQLTDYQYLSTYSTSGLIYQGVSGLQAAQVANPDLHWESNVKAELALELGFFKDRLKVNVAWFRNRSSDQLVAYTLPYLTGFASYQANLPALVQNTGWEFELSAVHLAGKDFGWTSSFNLTLPKNRLLDFPGLATSSYASSLVIGQDISQGLGYVFNGVDPATGKAQYTLVSGGTTPAVLKWGQTSPYFYGGLGTSLRYRQWSLDLFGQFSKQMVKGGIVYAPGLTRQNEYTYSLARWQKPGDVTRIPRASVVNDPYYVSSTANWFNASYLRLKNVALNYQLPFGKVYVQGQNLATLWHHDTALYDPETGNGIPPLRTVVVGLNFNF